MYDLHQTLTDILLGQLLVPLLSHKNMHFPHLQRRHKIVLSCHQSFSQHHMTYNPIWEFYGDLTYNVSRVSPGSTMSPLWKLRNREQFIL